MVSLRRPLTTAFISISKSNSVFSFPIKPFTYPLYPSLLSSWSSSLATTTTFNFLVRTSSTNKKMTTSLSSTSSESNNEALSTGYLNAKDASELDIELMSTPGFSLEQLMELAGLSCAEAIYQVIEEQQANQKKTTKDRKKPNILLICGPGNNGGDGLVAARHLVMFGYDCTIVYPKQSQKQHFINLIKQCTDLNIPVLTEMPSLAITDGEEGTNTYKYDVIVDSIFGFSFKGIPREPFASIINKMIQIQKERSTNSPRIVSVDIPSGWNVDTGDEHDSGFVPDVLVSLTAPKHSVKSFTGRHFIGGRFVPPALAKKYNINMPPYPGVSQVMEVPNPNNTYESWEDQYAQYCAEKESNLLSKQEKEDSNKKSSNGGWEKEYAQYCAEKEAKLREEDK